MTAATAPTNTPDRTTSSATSTAADEIRPLLDAVLGGDPPVRFEFWDGSALGPTDGAGTVHVRSVDALRRLVWAPGELGLARAFVAGDIDIDGDIFDVVETLRSRAPTSDRLRPQRDPRRARAARRLGALGKPPSRRRRRSGRAACATPSAATRRPSATTTTSATTSTASCSASR